MSTDETTPDDTAGEQAGEQAGGYRLPADVVTELLFWELQYLVDQRRRAQRPLNLSPDAAGVTSGGCEIADRSAALTDSSVPTNIGRCAVESRDDGAAGRPGRGGRELE